jgi:hypothetical protein
MIFFLFWYFFFYKLLYLWWLLGQRKKIGATLKRIPNGLGILNPEILNPDLQWGFGIYKSRRIGIWGAIHQLLNIILQLRILVLLPVSTMPYVVKVKNYS